MGSVVRRSVVLPPSADGAAAGAQQGQDQAEDEQDDPEDDQRRLPRVGLSGQRVRRPLIGIPLLWAGCGDLSDLRHGVWLLPTPDFRSTAFARRSGADAFWTRTTDPARALANLLERDQLFTDELTDQTQHTGVHAFHVDGTRTIDQTVDELAQRFGLHTEPE